jgi:hypothetical protein
VSAFYRVEKMQYTCKIDCLTCNASWWLPADYVPIVLDVHRCVRTDSSSSSQANTDS